MWSSGGDPVLFSEHVWVVGVSANKLESVPPGDPV